MKRTKTRIAASLLTSAFAMAAGALHLDWVGYDYFDRENGKNMLCALDPKCRQLTTEEITVRISPAMQNPHRFLSTK